MATCASESLTPGRVCGSNRTRAIRCSSSFADSTTWSAPTVPPGGCTAPTTDGARSTVNVSWGGSFSLVLTLGDNPLVTLEESVCDFSGPGASVDFLVN
jgi:hypothetical protein